MRATVVSAAAATVVALAAAACTGPGTWLGTDTAAAAELQRFGACGDLRGYFVDHALDLVGPYGLNESPHPFATRGPVAEDGAEGDSAATTQPQPTPQAAPAPDAGGRDRVAGEDFSATNVQEAGVGEPDLVKTDGRRLVTVSDGQLHVIDVSGDTPTETGDVTLPEGAGDQLLLAGDRALVLGHGRGHPVPLQSSTMPSRGHATPTTTLALVELAGEPQVAQSLTVDGAYVSARMVDGVARVVLRTQPVGLDFTTPEGGGVRAEREATAHNREVVKNSDVANWLPSFVRERPGEGVVGEGLLTDCASVHHPQEFAGLGLAAVFAVDPASGLQPVGAAAVVGAGDTVYATADNLYVATQRRGDRAGAGDDVRRPEPGQVTTALHRFSIASPRDPSYEASGEVPGRLLNQWALSEHDGHLRVATTQSRGPGPALEDRAGPAVEDRAEASESAVRVLNAELEQVGVVKGLGRGERIYAVRYAGDVGYVVTFRQVDPLYTLDLSDPTDPAVLGELKITGYSGYLHPLGGDRLLGFGQEATSQGRLQGAQVSMFDVAELADPRRVDRLTFPEAHTAVEDDHRALLHWPPEDLLVMPLEQHPRPVEPPLPEPQAGSAEPMPPRTAFSGAVVLRVDGQQLVEVGRVGHPGQGGMSPPIRRAVVVDDLLYTIGPEGVLASDLDTLEEVAWMRL